MCIIGTIQTIKFTARLQHQKFTDGGGGGGGGGGGKGSSICWTKHCVKSFRGLRNYSFPRGSRQYLHVGILESSM